MTTYLAQQTLFAQFNYVFFVIFFFLLTEILYFYLMKDNKGRRIKSVRFFIFGYKLMAMYAAFGLIIGLIAGIAILLWLLDNIKIFLSILLSIFAFWIYIEINRIWTKMFANIDLAKHTHNFKKGDKLIVKKGKGCGSIDDGEEVTFVRNGRYDYIFVKQKSGRSTEKKEERFEKRRNNYGKR